MSDEDRSTHTELASEMAELQSARTALANADMTLTGDPQEDHDAWEQMFVAASNLEEAATTLSERVRARFRDAEGHLDAMEPA